MSYLKYIKNVGLVLVILGHYYFCSYVLSEVHDMKNYEPRVNVTIQGDDKSDKKSEAKTIQITTGSNNTNTAYCYNDAVKQAATETITYVRENIVKLPETAAKLQKYEIKLVNANNFVITKNIMDTLLKRGLIKSSKTVSYNQKSVVFEVESYFSPEELGNKVQSSKLPMKPTKMEFGKKELVLDFAAE